MEMSPDDPRREMVEAIKSSGTRAAAVVQDLVSLARQGIKYEEIINLNYIVREYLSSPEYAKTLLDHGSVRLESNLAEDLLNIKGSPFNLVKVVMNLINNAMEAMPSGGYIEISTSNRYLDNRRTFYEPIPEGEYACLMVKDDGVGIADHDLKNIFEPFYTKKSMGRSGSGLSMTVVWSTVKEHEGYIDVSSREGQGTRFTVYLPATREEAAYAPQRVTLESYLGNEKILVVDDSPEQRLLADSMLSKLGYHVQAVSSGEEALVHLREHSPDLMVLDMIMPGLDGLETYQRVLQINPEQKAIIASGYSESQRVRELQRLGAGTYVQKPYTLEKIGMAVRRELDRA
jgi:CheY-like chemotaxis protein